MVIIDGKKIIFSESFIVRDGKEVICTIPTPGGPLPFTLLFLPPEEGTELSPTADFDGDAHSCKLTLKGWHNSLGSNHADPVPFGSSDTGQLFFQVAQHYRNGNNVVHFYVLTNNIHPSTIIE